ncbi:MAG: hypothetical protein J6B16_04685 [Clostridia bacterium]|nr:hypothetical protein [Clostridia bacterium]
MGIKTFFKNAISDMKKSAKAQHEVDKTNLAAVKAESKANFEENRGKNTLKKAKAIGRQSWNDAHMSPSERTFKMQEEREKQLAEANKRIEDANKRIEDAKNN